jgi:hypothetical protein
MLCSFVVLGLVACSSSSTSEPENGTGGAAATGGAPATGGTSGSGGAAGTAGAGGNGPALLRVGDPCTSDAECPGISGLVGTCMKDWPGGGACTIVGCSLDCPDTDSWCTLDKTGHKTYCAPFCQPGIIPCTRAGYVCAPSGGCLPPDVGGVVGGDN